MNEPRWSPPGSHQPNPVTRSLDTVNRIISNGEIQNASPEGLLPLGLKPEGIAHLAFSPFVLKSHKRMADVLS